MPAKRLTVMLSEDGPEVVFRIPNRKDLWIVFKQPPLLPMLKRTIDALEKGEDKPMSPIIMEGMIESRVESIDLADALLCRCALKPKLVREPQEQYPDGVDCVEEYDTGLREDIAGKLLDLAGFSEEAAKELLPFWRAPEKQPSTGLSPNNSTSDQANSSETSTPSNS